MEIEGEVLASGFDALEKLEYSFFPLLWCFVLLAWLLCLPHLIEGIKTANCTTKACLIHVEKTSEGLTALKTGFGSNWNSFSIGLPHAILHYTKVDLTTYGWRYGTYDADVNLVVGG